jgi:CheY-like chemotaxis protein
MQRFANGIALNADAQHALRVEIPMAPLFFYKHKCAIFTAHRDLYVYTDYAWPMRCTAATVEPLRLKILAPHIDKGVIMLHHPVSVPSVILCVDSESTGLWARCLLLSIAGYNVLTAVNVADALTIVQRNRVDLVMTGNFSSDPTGAQVASQMKRLKPAVPVALLTGSRESSREAERADLLLTDGMDPAEFLAEIGKLLSKSQPSHADAA